MSEGVVSRDPDRERISLFIENAGLPVSRLQVQAEALIYDSDSPAERLFLLESGQVRLFQAAPDQSTRLVSILGPGDWLGLTGLGEAGAYGMRAVAVTASVLWQFSTADVERRVSELPPIASELITQLARRLRQSHEAAARLVFDDCNQRLIKTLVHFSQTAAASPGEEGAVILRITHQQLAEAVGAARETISLALTQLRQRNLLRTGRNRVQFNPAALTEFAQRSATQGASVSGKHEAPNVGEAAGDQGAKVTADAPMASKPDQT